MQDEFHHVKLSSPEIQIVLSIIVMQYLSANSIRAHEEVLRCEYNWINTPAFALQIFCLPKLHVLLASHFPLYNKCHIDSKEL